MTPLPPAVLAGLLGWGTLAGVDLVSFPQALLSRPLVTGTVAGMLVGQPETGMLVGLLLELFALDVLPVGAARYPDYGPGVVGGVVLASGGAVDLTLGVAGGYALLIAVLGGWSLQVLRRINGRTLRRFAAGLAAGDAAAIHGVQYRGLAADVLRSLLLTLVAIGGGLWLRNHLPATDRLGLVTAVAVGTALAAAAGGAIRSAGREARLRWLAVGAGLGLVMAALR